ncbi:hypothetical protein [Pseudalkalibacillus salsuginis]|uniref:hypothetical protein n=1 Tax=Pseudalkalibacillus salsuginis TaxID=2910972 RepID=UPI001CD5BF31|nr:hypothetical protein [Pseudalkalibacillus salsuginis]MCF6411457.1 hypothetical protein [Pseudalkalibacillus salsuginis]
MNQLTTKELSYIEDEIRAEEITAKTINWCAAQCEDQALQKQLEELAESHQMKVGDLSKYFNRSMHIQ